MLVTVPTKGKQIRPIRRRGICAAAKALGVTRQHLYLVMIGERESPRIKHWLSKHMQEVRQ